MAATPLTGQTQELDMDCNIILDAVIAAKDLNGLQQYALQCRMPNGEPVDLASSAHLVSAYMPATQRYSRIPGQKGKPVVMHGRGIDDKGSLLHLLATSGKGCQYQLYVGRHKLLPSKGFGVRALELIPAGAHTCIGPRLPLYKVGFLS